MRRFRCCRCCAGLRRWLRHAGAAVAQRRALARWLRLRVEGKAAKVAKIARDRKLAASAALCCLNVANEMVRAAEVAGMRLTALPAPARLAGMITGRVAPAVAALVGWRDDLSVGR
jgi:hypothetical protein